LVDLSRTWCYPPQFPEKNCTNIIGVNPVLKRELVN